MKRIALLVLLTLAVPVLSWANSGTLSFSNTGGTISLTGSSLTLSGAQLTSVTMNGTNYFGNLGTVSFTTGSMMSSNSLGAVFNAGGSFTISGNGTDGIPNGVLFTGSFSGPVNLTGTVFDGTWSYTLTGLVTGKLSDGTNVVGNSQQFSITVAGGHSFGKDFPGNVHDGVTTVAVPEPGTLSLLGTGLVGLAGLIRRKLQR